MCSPSRCTSRVVTGLQGSRLSDNQSSKNIPFRISYTFIKIKTRFENLRAVHTSEVPIYDPRTYLKNFRPTAILAHSVSRLASPEILLPCRQGPEGVFQRFRSSPGRKNSLVPSGPLLSLKGSKSRSPSLEMRTEYQ